MLKFAFLGVYGYTPYQRSVHKSDQRKGKARKQALQLWSKCDKPLSWGSDPQSPSDTYRQLLVILNDDRQGQLATLKTSPETYTYLDLAKHFINIIQKRKVVAPVSPHGSFFPSLGLAMTRIHKTISSDEDNSYQSVITVFAKMLKKMDIHFVPWHKADRPNSRAYVVQGDWWLMLKPGSSAQINQRAHPEPAALHADLASQAHRENKHAPWSLPDKLQDMGPLWQKTVLPSDWSLQYASLSNTQAGHKNHYVKDTYEYVQNFYDGEIWWHHLALICGILFSKITPYVFAPTAPIFTKAIDTGPQLIAEVRKLAWLQTKSEHHRGITSSQPFVTMISTTIIALLDDGSPLKQRMVKMNNALGDGWTTKHGKCLSEISDLALITSIQATKK